MTRDPAPLRPAEGQPLRSYLRELAPQISPRSLGHVLAAQAIVPATWRREQAAAQRWRVISASAGYSPEDAAVALVAADLVSAYATTTVYSRALDLEHSLWRAGIFVLRHCPLWRNAMRALRMRIGVIPREKERIPLATLAARASLLPLRFRRAAAIVLLCGLRYANLLALTLGSLIASADTLELVVRPDKVTALSETRRYAVPPPLHELLRPLAVNRLQLMMLPTYDFRPPLFSGANCLPKQWPKARYNISLQQTRVAVIDQLLLSGMAEKDVAAFIGHALKTQRAHYRGLTPREKSAAAVLATAMRDLPWLPAPPGFGEDSDTGSDA